RIVAPVEILEHQQEGSGGGQYLESFRHLTQHSLLGNPEQLAGQRLSISPVSERRQLRRPGGSGGLEHAAHSLGTRLAQPPSKDLEDWQIRFRRSVVPQACPVRNQQVWVSRGPCPKGIKHGGLANAGLATDEHQLPLTGLCARQTLLELREYPLPSDGWCTTHRRRDACRTAARADEAVAPGRHGLDEARRRRIVLERATDL